MENKKVILIIMDGWGLGRKKESDAIQNANVPFVSSLYKNYPNSTLITCGEAVGLPEGQMGNSEVGHLNLGAGRIVYQELQRINVAIKNGEFQQNPVLLNCLDYAKENNKSLHLMGLLSDGGVHSHINHLEAITTLCNQKNLENVYIHAFTDGRDTDPKSGLHFLQQLQEHLNKTAGKIATVTGRYYAMDRDKRWERVKIAYDALVHRVGHTTDDIFSAVEASYQKEITDEFLLPVINSAAPGSAIKDGDAVICFNFRTDRCREITEVLTQTALPEYQMAPLDLYYTTMTMYNHIYKNIHVIFE
jgi:2,3-bisphosphoglycerate-independent phosphoglycerate mutase